MGIVSEPIEIGKLKTYKVIVDLESGKGNIPIGTIVKGRRSTLIINNREYDDHITIEDGRTWLDICFEEIK